MNRQSDGVTIVGQLRVFGGLRLWRSGVEVPIPSPRQRIVLAVLVAARGAVVSTAELIDILWAADPPGSAVNQVQRLIGQVRRLFEPELSIREAGGWVQPVEDGYRLRLDGPSCDLVELFDLAGARRSCAVTAPKPRGCSSGR